MCTLRAYGKKFDVDDFLERWPWKASGVFHRGEMRRKRKLAESGFNMGISDASWTDLAAQIRGATKFIRKNGTHLGRLKRFPDVDGIQLDFPVNSRLVPPGVWLQEEYFPAPFIRLAGTAGLAIALSIYPRPRARSRTTSKTKG